MARALLTLFALLAASGCTADDEYETVVIQGGVSASPPVSGGAPDADRVMWPHEIAVTDPCDCSSQACLDQWVDDNLGCNVCISLWCDGQPAGHICSQCAQAPYH